MARWRPFSTKEAPPRRTFTRKCPYCFVRKEALADRFYHQLICQRCLAAWLSYVWKEKQERKIREQHDERASKMASLLKAAASGQFWQKSEDNTSKQAIDPFHDSNSDEVEEIFLPPSKRGVVGEITSKENKESSSRSKKNEETKHVRKPSAKQAWPHEILRDMKTKKTHVTRRETPTKIVSSDVNKEKDALGSATRNDSNTNPKTKHECETNAPMGDEGHSKRTDVCGEKSNVKIEDVAMNRTSASKLEVGDESSQAPLTTRSTSSMTSKQSKATSRKPSTKPLHLAMEERAKARAERKMHLESKRRAAEDQKLATIKSLHDVQGTRKCKQEEKSQYNIYFCDNYLTINHRSRCDYRGKYPPIITKTEAELRKEQELKEMEIEAEKEAMFQKKREEKKIVKQRELEKYQRMEELKELNQKADDHYRSTLVRMYGLKPWKRMMKDIKDQTCSAVRFSENRLREACFRGWLRHTKTECELRDEQARRFCNSLLLRRGWLSWRKYRHHLNEMNHIALDFSNRHLVRKYVRIWQDYVTEERLLYWDKENRADEHNERRIKQVAMTYWRKYIPLLRDEEKREKRREDLRKHVQSLLPDFRGNKLNNSP